MPKNKKLALDSGIQTNQILTNDDEVCIPRLSSILLAVLTFILCHHANDPIKFIYSPKLFGICLVKSELTPV